MQPLDITSNLTDRVYQAILDEILDGRLGAGQHLVQEQLAIGLGVSRQPVQQAMTRLKADGVVEEAGRRGLRVAAVDFTRVAHHYGVRGVLDGYAARMAARAVRAGTINPDALAERAETAMVAGDRAAAGGSMAEMIRQDEAFHKTIYHFSGNPVVREVSEPTWRYVRRAMADVLRHAKPPAEIQQEHRAILDAILAGDGDRADRLSQDHTRIAAERLQVLFTARDAEDTP